MAQQLQSPGERDRDGGGRGGGGGGITGVTGRGLNKHSPIRMSCNIEIRIGLVVTSVSFK